MLRSLFALASLASLLLPHFTGAAPIAGSSLSTITLERRSEAGPLIDGANFPDPGIIRVGSTWYSFATRTKGSSIHIQIAQSNDFVTWTIVKNSDGSQRDALPSLPAWVNAADPATWAPDVNRLSDGSFIMYYSASVASSTSKHCVGAAKSRSVLGPYKPVGNSALYCPLDQGGAIDASGYNDNGQRYVIYKVDGNSQGHGGACGNDVAPYVPIPIVLQPVSADGVTPAGSATTILNNNGASDDGIVEAPSLVKSGNTYVLFFSSGCFTTGDYTVNYATAPSITGPYTRASRPLFQTGDYGLTAPGGMDVDADGRHLLFHANYGNGRGLYSALITVKDTTVTA